MPKLLCAVFSPSESTVCTHLLITSFVGSFSLGNILETPIHKAMQNHNPSDPSDWNYTKLPRLKGLDSSMRCLICHDFFKGPVITSCSHTFCSYCIRDYLREHPICPACRAPEQESRLRKNKVMEDILDSFFSIRMELIQILKKDDPPEDISNGDDAPALSVPNSQSSTEEWDESETPHSSSSTNRKKRKIQNPVVCPVCSREVSQSEINQHLDTCLANPDQSSTEDAPFPPENIEKHLDQNPINNFVETNKELPESERVRIPKLTYALLSESKIRSKLAEMGLPTDGNKQVLQRRHAQWVTMYNSNLDQKYPISKKALLAQLRKWEKTQSNTNPVSKEKLGGTDWGSTYADDFADLVKKAKNTVKKSVPSSPNEQSTSTTIDNSNN
ncbi:Rad18 Rhp18 [Schizosaccharomyces cryophilus OY26]|uniref:Postreplication repair E3 ubiquitin-protein ligase RAD18 n=1 Tax=Schizosaccharomyces cryophilus (strain OY26 / ATCC MYA-4695 / CBS 11777 / NBRC 106824 / NRRL Y48691) TaxID=653667 RepID=S9X6L6_SCHCR|nr:Rad18 Rhp18 [Schizosaccharomyces cryophilus OY26]EPY49406.1 Rad18 Rhp18 [Schizosaccharomyces cryophilus OY26]